MAGITALVGATTYCSRLMSLSWSHPISFPDGRRVGYRRFDFDSGPPLLGVEQFGVCARPEHRKHFCCQWSQVPAGSRIVVALPMWA